jgi:hypothetical protein
MKSFELLVLIVIAFGLLWGSTYFFVKSIFGEKGACRYSSFCQRSARSVASYLAQQLRRLIVAAWRWASPRIRRLLDSLWRKLTS